MMDSLEDFSSDLIASHADLLTIIGNTLLRARLTTNQREDRMLKYATIRRVVKAGQKLRIISTTLYTTLVLLTATLYRMLMIS